MMLILVVQLGFDLLVVFQIPTKLLLEGRLDVVVIWEVVLWVSSLMKRCFGVERQLLWVHHMENWILVHANT